jgi:phosphoserine aminotransferase
MKYNRTYNFSAGPAMMPEPVLEEIRDEMMNYRGSGMCVMEMSHRSKVFQQIIDEAEADLRDLMGIPDNYKVLFIQGGATLQFAAVPWNLMKNGKAVYVETGAWSKKAIAEAKKYGEVIVAASSKDKNYSYIPDCSDLDIPDDADYVYICENETIHGVTWQKLPNTKGHILVSDQSSMFLSQPCNVSDYGMIYAVQTMVGDSMIFKVICIAFLITLFANMAAWSFGVNSVARYAAEHGNMPKVFASMISDDDMPNGANLVNAIVASLVLCLQLVPIDAISNGVFWMLFGTSVVFLLLTYIPMFPAFLNLRKNDPNRARIFTFPFKGVMMKVMLAIPCIELILAIVATLIPFSVDEIGDKVPMIVIFIVLLLIGEVVRAVSAKGRETEYKGLTPELAAQRLAEEAAEAEEN